MAETQRIRIFGVKPSCSNKRRLEQNRLKRRQMLQERSRRVEKSDEFIHHESSEDEEQIITTEKQLLKTSFNFADYVRSRESDTEIRKFSRQFGSRHLLSHDLLKEFPISTENVDKVFCSQWLSDRQILFGTKCNKLMVYDVAFKKSLHLTSLSGRSTPSRANMQPVFGIHSIQINPSRTLLATVGKNNKEVAVYRLPTLDPVCVGEDGHTDWIYDMCWLDDEFLVSGSKDSNLCLWQITTDMYEASDKEDVLTHWLLKPAAIKKSKSSEMIRGIVYNTSYKEIFAYSTNGYVHVWSAENFKHKLSRKVPIRQDFNPCLSIYEDKLYAVACGTNMHLLDARTLHAVKKFPIKTNQGVKSTSFQGSVLTMGTGLGTVTFYDMRANKYLESAMNSNRTVQLKTSKGFLQPDEGHIDGAQNSRYLPAIYTHCYDASGTRLFCAGGPLQSNLYGNYVGLWQ